MDFPRREEYGGPSSCILAHMLIDGLAVIMLVQLSFLFSLRKT